MPTGGRLAGAILFAALMGYVSFMTIGMFEGINTPRWYHEINIAAGAIIGWHIAGPKAGLGYVAGASLGLTTVITAVFFALFTHGITQMFRFAIKSKYYDGPVEAVVDAMQIALKTGSTLTKPEVIGTLLIGGIIAGIVTEFVDHRFS